MACEEAVIATNDDAAQCKRHAVEKGYWNDPYVSLLVPRGGGQHAPEINRGYYARVMAVRILVEKFINMTNKQCQIVNLGAGFDTSYWRLKSEDLAPVRFVEIDFPTVTSRKCHFIKSKKPLLEKLTSEDADIMLNKSDLHAEDYHIVGLNLRNLVELDKKLMESQVDRSLPTLFIAECVLVYIDIDACDKLLKWIADNFPTAFFINYEQVNMTDRFGQVMIENLKARDCYLQGVQACASLDTQTARFLNQGWEGADACDMSQVYSLLPQADVQRIERLEFLDERELLNQLFSHYCMAWAYKDLKGIGLSSISLA